MSTRDHHEQDIHRDDHPGASVGKAPRGGDDRRRAIGARLSSWMTDTGRTWARVAELAGVTSMEVVEVARGRGSDSACDAIDAMFCAVDDHVLIQLEDPGDADGDLARLGETLARTIRAVVAAEVDRVTSGIQEELARLRAQLDETRQASRALDAIRAALGGDGDG